MRKNRMFGLLFTVGGLVTLASCGNSAESLDYVSLRINPEVEMLVNEDGVVVDAVAKNDDGEEVLENTTLEGENVSEAAKKFTNAAIELGFFNTETGKNVVYVAASASSDEAATTLEATIKLDLTDFFKDNQIDGKAVKDEIVEETSDASIYGKTRNEMIIINRILEENPTLDINVLVTLDYAELVSILKDMHTEAKNMTKEERIKAREDLEKLQEKYSVEINLKNRINQLIAKINSSKISEDAKAVLNAELLVLQASFNENEYNEYEAEASAAIGNLVNVKVSANNKKNK